MWVTSAAPGEMLAKNPGEQIHRVAQQFNLISHHQPIIFNKFERQVPNSHHMRTLTSIPKLTTPEQNVKRDNTEQ
jgi:hypothetical protein